MQHRDAGHFAGGLRGTVKWRGNPLLIAGGVLGMLPALHLLFHVDARIFRIGFGAFLVAYAATCCFARRQPVRKTFRAGCATPSSASAAAWSED